VVFVMELESALPQVSESRIRLASIRRFVRTLTT
jgi:hypothetical protein